ncbi:MAG: hypothetical protein LBQ12_00275, partial [Deltaproteobacteria bacterium]|nr:hypothetical protein [Deltaproteobacteria bacterium]
METPEALRRIDACLATVMEHLTAPQAGSWLGWPKPAYLSSALAALDEGIDLFAAHACPGPQNEAFASAAMRLFFSSLYLGSIERAKAVVRHTDALGDEPENRLKDAYGAFYLMHYSLRTGKVMEAREAYLEIQRVERIPEGLMGPDTAGRTFPAIYDARWAPPPRGCAGIEIMLPSPPLMVRSYSIAAPDAGDRFPLQYVNGREGFRGILASAEVNRLRAFAVTSEPLKAQMSFDSAMSRNRYGPSAGVLVPALCTMSSAWARVGDSERAAEILERLPPEPWPVRPVYGQLKLLCLQEANRIAGRLDTALEIHRAWPSGGLRELQAVPWAIGTARLAGSLCKAGAMRDAERMAEGLFALGGDLSLEAIRVQTALGIMDAFAARGRFRKAEKLCRAIESSGSGFHPSMIWTLFRGEADKLRLDARAILSARLAAKGRPARRLQRPPSPRFPRSSETASPDAADFARAAADGRGPGYGAEYGECLARAVKAEAAACAAADSLAAANADAAHAASLCEAAAEASRTGRLGLGTDTGYYSDYGFGYGAPPAVYLEEGPPPPSLQPPSWVPRRRRVSVLERPCPLPGPLTGTPAALNGSPPGTPGGRTGIPAPASGSRTGIPAPASGSRHVRGSGRGTRGRLSDPASDSRFAASGPFPGSPSGNPAALPGSPSVSRGPLAAHPSGSPAGAPGPPAGVLPATAPESRSPGSYGQGSHGAGAFGQGTYGEGSLGQGSWGAGAYGQGSWGAGRYGQGSWGSARYVQDDSGPRSLRPVRLAWNRAPSPGALELPPRAAAKAAAIISLRVDALLRRGAPLAAARALSFFDSLPQTDASACARFNLAAKTISSFGREGDLRSACALYRAVAMSETASRYPGRLCVPGLTLINACLEAGSPEPAAEVFARLPLELAPADWLPELGEAARRTIRSLLPGGDFDWAEALHREMSRLGDSPEAAALRARASLDLVLALEGAGLSDRSLAAFRKMSASSGNPEAEKARILALRSLFPAAAGNGRRERALALLNTADTLCGPMEARLMRARALSAGSRVPCPPRGRSRRATSREALAGERVGLRLSGPIPPPSARRPPKIPPPATEPPPSSPASSQASLRHPDAVPLPSCGGPALRLGPFPTPPSASQTPPPSQPPSPSLPPSGSGTPGDSGGAPVPSGTGSRAAPTPGNFP